MPFVELNGVELHDSGFIMRDLIKQLDKTNTEAHLTSEQRGAARAFEQMAENTTTPYVEGSRRLEYCYQDRL